MTYPTPPAPGMPVSATLIREIISCLKCITPKGGKNTRVSIGPNGATIDGEPGGKRGSGERNMLFAVGLTEKDGEDVRAIVNCYYMVGGVMHHINDVEWDAEEWRGGYLCFQMPAGIPEPDAEETWQTTVVHAEDDQELLEMQTDSTRVVYPLYKLGDEPEDADDDWLAPIEIDLRPLINIQLFENI